MSDAPRNDRSHGGGPPPPADCRDRCFGRRNQGAASLLEDAPTDSGAAFIVVVHLDPEHRSELPHIIAAHTRMPVLQVTHREKLIADHVYVIPPDRGLHIVDHEVSATAFDEPRGRRAAIDLVPLGRGALG